MPLVAATFRKAMFRFPFNSYEEKAFGNEEGDSLRASERTAQNSVIKLATLLLRDEGGNYPKALAPGGVDFFSVRWFADTKYVIDCTVPLMWLVF